MADHNCKNCAFRGRYEQNPKSFLGRIWRWHANWCPGWKRYMKSLPDMERITLVDKYGMEKYRSL
ncbi:MAG: hypothetical protein V2J25_15415 [Desulfatiglans sp.]|nr:hypothetical protein [Desulfatiglans sp.]